LVPLLLIGLIYIFWFSLPS